MADLEPIVGRYVRLTLGGRANRVYFEEAGQGTPLVCLHTAGSDGRQFRHLMIQSPAETRWETLWGYMQGGPGVFKGDLHFYRVDGDFRDRVGRIDTARCPLYLLTGEYDFSCTPDDTRATAEKIPGEKFTIMQEMQEIGHFPMSEHPEQFRNYLLPVLDEIRGLAR